MKKMSKRLPFLLLLSFSATMMGAGCFGQNPQRAGIGLLDLQKVLTELQLETHFEEKLQAKDQTLSRQLEERRERYENMLVSRREKMGEELTDEERAELMRFEAQANQQLQEMVQSSQQQLRQYQQQLISDLHDKVRPAVREIAAEKNLSIIMLRGDIFFMVDEELDITNTLVEYIRQRPDFLESLRPQDD